MRIQEIRTKGLFKLFDHTIRLNLDDRITLIHGPNGYGKTAILQLVSGIFETGFSILRTLPFDRVEIEFDDASILRLVKGPDNSQQGERRTSRVDLHYRDQNYTLPSARSLTRGIPVSALSDFLPIQRVADERWLVTGTKEVLDLDAVVDRFSEELQRFTPDAKEARLPEWLRELRSAIDVHFIRANRLEHSEWVDEYRHSRRASPVLVVEQFASELAEHIKVTLAKYAELSQSLDRSFPSRLVTSPDRTSIPTNELRNTLNLLEQKRDRLTDAGLLDKEEQAHFEVPANIEETKASVLSVYAKDVEQKLSVFDDLFAKIDLFTNILNRRFSFKTVLVDKNRGILFRTFDDQPLAPSSLSSGEQHEVVLLYQLLFKVKPQSLILIDEPELSLHITWQEQFLHDITQITGLSRFDILIATHSPQIISDRWDLTVELEGPRT